MGLNSLELVLAFVGSHLISGAVNSVLNGSLKIITLSLGVLC